MGFLNSIFFFFLFINQFVLIHLPPVAAAHVLRQGDQLDQLVSDGGKFTLGFYRVRTAIYLGIWYTYDFDRKVIWIANRDIPMFSYDGGALMLDESGTLKVIRGGGINTTLFNVFTNEVGSGKGNTRAVLEDSGNFVLDDNTDRILWQSFDHPTDTLLPGMKLGYNRTTRQNLTLTSWLRNYDPASGAFTMILKHINKKSHKLVIYRHGKVYWTSGAWRGGKKGFGNVEFDNTLDNTPSVSLVYDASGMSFVILKNMIQLSSMGEIIKDGTDVLTPRSCYRLLGNKQVIWGDNGCAAISPLPECRDKHESFQFKPEDNSNISISDCMEICLNDCNCKGFSTLSNSAAGGCYTWDVLAAFTPDKTAVKDGGVLLSEKLPKQEKSKTQIWVVSAATVVPLLCFAAFFYYVKIGRRRLEEMRRDDYIHKLIGSSDSFNYGDELEKGEIV